MLERADDLVSPEYSAQYVHRRRALNIAHTHRLEPPSGAQSAHISGCRLEPGILVRPLPSSPVVSIEGG